jgi:alkaline phosphatase
MEKAKILQKNKIFSMKTSITTLLLATLGFLFLGFACSQKPQKPVKNIIFLIGDGTGLAQIQAAMTAKRSSLNIESMPVIGLHKSHSADSYITDSAAGATAFACGQKTTNNTVGLDSLGKPMPTILELAAQKGMATGLVATCALTHATPASFAAHVSHRKMQPQIAQQMAKAPIDVMIGGGRKFFEPHFNELKQKGFQITDTLPETLKIKKGKLAAFLAEEHQPKMQENRGEMLKLTSMKAIELLSQNPKGFFLMIEGSQIDWGGHANDIDYVVQETLDFDQTIGAVLEWAKKDGQTLVVITGDHETGGLTLLEGDFENGTVEAHFSTKHHTGVMIPVYAFGPASSQFSGFYQNSDIFYKFKQALGL